MITQPKPYASHLHFDELKIRSSLHMQVLAKIHPGSVNWPDEPWLPRTEFDAHLKSLRSLHES